MKRWICVLLLMLVLCGCGAEETLETVADEWILPAMASPREMTVQLPEDALVPVLEQENSQLYMGDGYELMLEVFDAGDLNATIRCLCGYDRDSLTVMETHLGEEKRYDFVWTGAGEKGDCLGRGTILDDGAYHYCLSVLRDSGESRIAWSEVFGSFALD